MKKETYLRKLAATQITDDNTVGEAKAAKKIEAELNRFWKKAALEFVSQNETLVDCPWIKVDMDFNLKADGSIIVKLLDMDERMPYAPFYREVKHYTIPKRHLFK